MSDGSREETKTPIEDANTYITRQCRVSLDSPVSTQFNFKYTTTLTMAETQPPTNQTTQHGQPRPVTITAADGSSQEINFKPNAGASIPDKQAIGNILQSRGYR
jgi:hypothetical protein